MVLKLDCDDLFLFFEFILIGFLNLLRSSNCINFVYYLFLLFIIVFSKELVSFC